MHDLINMKKINKVAILGVGLLGGSFGKALIKNKLAKKVIGIGRNKSRLRKAIMQRAIDEMSLDIRKVKEADLVVISTPVIHIEETLKKISSYFKKGSIVIDTGSTKAGIVRAATKYINHEVYFVGCHPIAGSEKSGVDFSTENLFNGSICVITPVETTSKEALLVVKTLWEQLKAEVVMMSPNEHDRVIALTSHLPHFIASSLVLSAVKEDKNILALTGKGFKDTTRIAASSPELWIEIAAANKNNIITSLKIFLKNLNLINNYIKQGNFKKIKELLYKAKELREDLN